MNHFLLITCEHGGNRIPSRYRHLLADDPALLRTHQGYDAGALRMAREMAAQLHAPLYASTVSRLLIDLNRSTGHRNLHCPAVRNASSEVRDEIRQRYYIPYRSKVEMQIVQAVDAGHLVIHVSSHSFTPQLDGKLRNADIGLLYDPARPGEAAFCRLWRTFLLQLSPALKVRLNYPYLGSSDGFTTALRRRFGALHYLGIELEINQAQMFGDLGQWRQLRSMVTESLRLALQQFQCSVESLRLPS